MRIGDSKSKCVTNLVSAQIGGLNARVWWVAGKMPALPSWVTGSGFLMGARVFDCAFFGGRMPFGWLRALSLSKRPALLARKRYLRAAA